MEYGNRSCLLAGEQNISRVGKVGNRSNFDNCLVNGLTEIFQLIITICIFCLFLSCVSKAIFLKLYMIYK